MMEQITPDGLLGRFYDIRVEGLNRPIHFKATRLFGSTLIGENEEQETYLIMLQKIRGISRQGVEYALQMPERRPHLITRVLAEYAEQDRLEREK